MAKVHVTSRIPEDLFDKVKGSIDEGVFNNITSVVEEALRVYFANINAKVWEKRLNGGWVKKLVVRDNKVVFESIRSRKIYTRFNLKYYTDDALNSRGWSNVWKMKKEV